jgi:hypothetical protein
LPPDGTVFVTGDAPTKFSSISPKAPCAPAPSEAARSEAASAPGPVPVATPGAGGAARAAGERAAAAGGGDTGCTLFKVFSRGALAQAELEGLFDSPSVVGRAGWRAYPKFSPPEKFAPFELAPGLVYSNALENAASAMEVSAVAAHNSALLVAQHLKARVSGRGGSGRGPSAAAPPAA